MAIGTFGPVTFEVSVEKTRTFDEFSRKTAAKFEEHAIIGQKAKLEFISPGLDEISFQVIFSAFHGLNPLNEVKQLREIVQKGEYHPLVIGNETLSNFVIESISEAWKYVDNQGFVLYIAVDVNLKEYYLEPDPNAVKETTDTAAVQKEKAEKVAAAVQEPARKTGLSVSQIAEMATIAVSCVRDPSLAITGMESILAATTDLQTGNASAAATASYIRMGLDVANLSVSAKSDPMGTAISVLDTLGSTSADKPTAAKSIYGSKAAGTVLQVVQKLREG
ncbi:phage tail protein [Sporomusa sphaeroides]|uniref:Phage P2 GpU n=1 Tax=Sporomusa sphaeroides DSM 2875 TaxID=1337886 RepID=A0ABM9VZX7_9FIRM|nr:phage tail protein [Sporomusa sphaeroides]OLS56359.1 phage P2 GpU [Sporomusa sphaeroides DSM 2875]CVK18454.1 Phage P2 GpU [Sporomusa sphaeroides DSM 2875]